MVGPKGRLVRDDIEKRGGYSIGKASRRTGLRTLCENEKICGGGRGWSRVGCLGQDEPCHPYLKVCNTLVVCPIIPSDSHVMQGVQGIKSEDIIEMMMMMVMMMMINKPSALAFFRVPFQTDLHGEVEKVCKN